MDNQLNEKNLQLAFNFNPSDGALTKNRITGEILIEENSKRIAIQESSDKVAIDLGYSIDGDTEDMEFTLNLEKLLIKRVYQKWDLVEVSIKENEVIIVNDEPSLKTCLWLNKNSIGKTLNYKIISQNTSISSWMFDIIARKLNKFDVDDIVSLKESVSSINTSLTTLNDEVTELQNNSGSSGGEVPDVDENGYSIMRQKVMECKPKIIEQWIEDIEVTRFSDGRAIVRCTIPIYNPVPICIQPGGCYHFWTYSPVKIRKIYSWSYNEFVPEGNNISRYINKYIFNIAFRPYHDEFADDPDYGALMISYRNVSDIPQTPDMEKIRFNIECEIQDDDITDFDYYL